MVEAHWVHSHGTLFEAATRRHGRLIQSRRRANGRESRQQSGWRLAFADGFAAFKYWGRHYDMRVSHDTLGRHGGCLFLFNVPNRNKHFFYFFLAALSTLSNKIAIWSLHGRLCHCNAYRNKLNNS